MTKSSTLHKQATSALNTYQKDIENAEFELKETLGKIKNEEMKKVENRA